MADKLPCAFSDPRPELTLEGKCTSGACGDFTEELQWDDALGAWTNKSGMTVYWDANANDYRVGGPGKGGVPVAAGGTYACSPFRLLVSNWGPDEDGCTFDITVTES